MYTATLTIDTVVPKQTIQLQSEMSVRQLIEATFISLQTATVLDPFKYDIEFFGYDHYQGVTSYLGYGIVSIDDRLNNDHNYWEVVVNGKASTEGIDSFLVQAGDEIELKWVAVSNNHASSRSRTRALKSASIIKP